MHSNLVPMTSSCSPGDDRDLVRHQMGCVDTRLLVLGNEFHDLDNPLPQVCVVLLKVADHFGLLL